MRRFLEEWRRFFVAVGGTAVATTITVIVSLFICASLLVSNADTNANGKVGAFIVGQVKLTVHNFSSKDRIRGRGSTAGVFKERFSPSVLSLSSSRPSSSPGEDKKKGTDQTQYSKRRRKESTTSRKNKHTDLPVSNNQTFPRSEAIHAGDDTMKKDVSADKQNNNVDGRPQVSTPRTNTDHTVSDTSTPDSSTAPSTTTTAAAAAAASTHTPDLMFTDALLQYSIDSFLSGQYDRPFKEDAPAPLPDLTAVETVDAALRALRKMDVVVSPYGGSTGNRDDDDRGLNGDDDTHSPSHGAAVLLRFCAPLSRAERWGLSSAGTVARSVSDMTTGHSGRVGGEIEKPSSDSWKELMRGSLTPHMLAKRMRCSQAFSGLLDWEHLDVSSSSPTTTQQLEKDCDDGRSTGTSNRADVDAVLYYSDENCDHDNSQKRSYKHRGETDVRDGKSTTAGTRDVIRFHMVRLNGVWLIESAEKISLKQ